MSLMTVTGLGKAFRDFSSEWKRIGTWFGVPFRPSSETWVLRDVGFSIHPGEAIGIVGQNGAGKSTLLKIITGTLRPTTGEVRVNGRIAAMLELGMGFNPDLTGRQNVYHSASIMGFGQAEVEKVIDEIEAFAEIGQYFDEPVRIYSSGMQVRVAFAVATAWRPEILIVDEALSVGDSYFQHKSFSRIREFQDQGSTLLIVSHDRGSIQALCNRALLLEKGSVIKDGDPEEVMDFYNALIAEKENQTVEVKKLDNGKAQTSSGTGEARITEIVLLNASGKPADHIAVGENVELCIGVKVFRAIDSLVMGYGIKDRLGQVMYGTNTWHTGQVIENPEINAEYRFRIAFPANLGVGSYSVVTALHAMESHIDANYEWRDLALVFNVVNVNKIQFQGCNWIEPKISL
jgi:lipopolysaccharide transport system ATP-binding protein